jgi:NAD(P)-dependent dehydrogenase (short-subunit alcohol dehydrogenase family)
MMYRAKPSDGVAWVTGASLGIGRAVALELAHRKFSVAATSRRASELESLTKQAPAIFSFPGDITDRAAMAALVSRIESVHGQIALAFLNAGIYFIAELDRFSADVVWRTFETNVGGTVNCLAPMLAAMELRGKGQIAIMSSLAGYGGIARSSAYGASKAALIYMAEALKLTYEPKGLTIQIVNPGFVHTAMTAQNKFKMPFIMGADRAATLICDGFKRGGFEIAFPRRFAYSFKAMCLLPYALYFPMMGRAANRTQR